MEKIQVFRFIKRSYNYGTEGFLVWYPKKKCFATADYEHEEFKELCNIKDFFENPPKQIDKIFE